MTVSCNKKALEGMIQKESQKPCIVKVHSALLCIRKVTGKAALVGKSTAQYLRENVRDLYNFNLIPVEIGCGRLGESQL
jgi:hypothetical protein